MDAMFCFSGPAAEQASGNPCGINEMLREASWMKSLPDGDSAEGQRCGWHGGGSVGTMQRCHQEKNLN